MPQPQDPDPCHRPNAESSLVAVVVCGFAVGMAGLLNYFKYRSTANGVVAERLTVTGKSVETSIQSSLALGLHFSDIGTLPGTLERERATDDLIQGIDVFDVDGKMLYSTDRLRSGRPAPQTWMNAVHKSGGGDWLVDADGEAAAGISIKNNFGLTIGHLARALLERAGRRGGAGGGARAGAVRPGGLRRHGRPGLAGAAGGDAPAEPRM